MEFFNSYMFLKQTNPESKKNYLKTLKNIEKSRLND